MARLLFWCVYHVDLGPLGPTTLGLAPRVWQTRERVRATRSFLRNWRRTLFSKPDLVKINESKL
jgi:hypothetical protein